MRDGPEEEHDTRGAEQGTHGVDHPRHLRRVAGKMGEEVGGEHEERCARRVTDLQFVTCCNKLRTVPETGCRLDSAAIYKGRNKEGEPSEYIVN